VPVLKAKDVNIQFDSTEELAVIDPEDIRNAIEDWNKKASIRRMAAKEEWLKSLVDEYRSERRKSERLINLYNILKHKFKYFAD